MKLDMMARLANSACCAGPRVGSTVAGPSALVVPSNILLLLGPGRPLLAGVAGAVRCLYAVEDPASSPVPLTARPGPLALTAGGDRR